uniref:hypothetical protein n=1 Tax=Paraburkholderia sp. RL17-337-BIB-A TaxID=3031636 RepID=UPI0038B8A7DE
MRDIDHFLDLRDLRQHLAPFYSPMGRPAIDPELMIRILRPDPKHDFFNTIET